jgi:ribosome maturation factor RimP
VSSPGIDRPLTKARDFERFAGFKVRIESGEMIDGRRRFIGMLKGVRDDAVVVVLDGGDEAAVPLGAIIRAKLVLTDELLAAHKA